MRAAAAGVRARPERASTRSRTTSPSRCDDPERPGLPRPYWGLHNTGQTVNGVAGTADADIDAPEAWDMTTGSTAVTVGVADTGIAYDHPDLAANIWLNPGESGGGKETNGVDDDGNGKVDDFRGWDFVDERQRPDGRRRPRLARRGHDRRRRQQRGGRHRRELERAASRHCGSAARTRSCGCNERGCRRTRSPMPGRRA